MDPNERPDPAGQGLNPQSAVPHWLDIAPLPIFIVRDAQPERIVLNRRATELFMRTPTREADVGTIFENPLQLQDLRRRLQDSPSVSDVSARLRGGDGAALWGSMNACRASHEGLQSLVIIPWPLRPCNLPTAGAPQDFAFWKAVFDHAGVAIAVLDRNLKPQMLNQFARELFGFGDDDGQGFGIERIIHPDDWPETQQQWRALLAGEIGSFRAEKRYLRKDRKVFWGDVSVTGLGDYAERPPLFLAFIIDITERRRVEERLQRSNRKLVRQLHKIRALKEQLQELALRDPLTGLYNRRHMEDTLHRELARSAREQLPLSLVMMDLDEFKALNDHYGHPAGDRVLVALARILRSGTRIADVCCRIGGEEFLAILPGASIETARQRAEHWRKALEQQRIRHGGIELRSTLSLGVAAFPQHGQTVDTLIAQVDGALYAAKRGGRNRVIVQP